MPRKQQNLNRTNTAMNGPITDAATAITVADGTVFPADGDFNVAVGNEIMLVTGRSGNVLTVQRGVEDTEASAHVAGDYVFPVLCGDGLNRFFSDCVTYQQQGLVIPDKIQAGGEVLTSADFTQEHISSSTIIDETWGGITIAARTEIFVGTYLRQLSRPEPSTPYTVTAHVKGGAGNAFQSDYKRGQMCGIGWEDGTTGEVITCGARFNKEVTWSEMAAYNTATPTIRATVPFYFRQDCWMRLSNDGTTLSMEVSYNGVSFFPLYSEAVGTFITPDKIFFFTHNGLTSGPKRFGSLLGWCEE
jgi:hypothetical protein